jgi:hypothetical protein
LGGQSSSRFCGGWVCAEFDVNAVYSDGRVEDYSVQLASGTTVFAIAGLTFAASKHLRVTAERFYS